MWRNGRRAGLRSRWPGRGHCGFESLHPHLRGRAGPAALGDAAPDGPILGARVEHLGAKEALLADDPDVYFTTPHFDGFPAVLVRLERIAPEELEELIRDAWLARAPRRLAQGFLDGLG